MVTSFMQAQCNCLQFNFSTVDRMELHALLNEEELKSASFVVFINSMIPSDTDEQTIDTNLVEDIEEELEIGRYKEAGKVEVVGLVKHLKDKIRVKEEGADLHGNCCP